MKFQGYAHPVGELRWGEEQLADAWRESIEEHKRRTKEENRLVKFNENGLDALLDVESVMKPGRWYTRGDLLDRIGRELKKTYTPAAIASILKSLVISGRVRSQTVNVGKWRDEPSTEMTYQVRQ